MNRTASRVNDCLNVACLLCYIWDGNSELFLDVLQHLDQLEAFIPLAAANQSDPKASKNEVVPASKQLTMVKVKYTIHKVSILLMEDRTPVGIQPGSAGSEGYVKPLLKAELNNLYIGLLKKNYEIPITLSLESVSLVHLQIKLVKVESQDDLITVLCQLNVFLINKWKPIPHTYIAIAFSINLQIWRAHVCNL